MAEVVFRCDECTKEMYRVEEPSQGLPIGLSAILNAYFNIHFTETGHANFSSSSSKIEVETRKSPFKAVRILVHRK